MKPIMKPIMTGNEQHLKVYLGSNQIAKITLIHDQLHWQYTPSWQDTGFAISPHLALHGDIPPLNVQRFLRNLLPEGNLFDEIIHCFHLSKYNTFALIRALGMDISGSLIILAPEQPLPQTASFRVIPDDELTQRLDSRDTFSMVIWDGKPRLSVAGVQEKINIMLNKEGQLGFGEGNLCSTHLLKFEKHKLSHLVLNEYITMQLAKRCGITVANVELMQYGEHRALLIERFDRQFFSMSKVKRRHIIDGCQALNLPPEYKYERNFGSARDVTHIRDGASLLKLFELTKQCLNPALTKQQIIDWVLFNVLIFNYDAHGKNISFFVGYHGLTLAPFYDLINIKMYPDFEQDMAMGLGDEFDGSAIHAYQLADFADSCQLPRSLVTKRLKILIKKLRLALPEEVNKITSNDDEQRYLKRYHEIVSSRCQYLLEQAKLISTIEI